MKKPAAVLAITIVMLSVACGFLLYQFSELQNLNDGFEEQIREYQNQTGQLTNQIDELEKQTSELEKQLDDFEDEIYQRRVSDAKQVKITKFSVYGWNHVSIEVMSFCNVTVQNFGTNDIDGLTIRISGVNQIEDGWRYEGEQEVGLIKAGETKIINIESSQSMMFYSIITATLILDDIKIDESTDDTIF